MDIVCSPDKKYVMPTGVMICSLCENNKEEEINFHIIYANLSEKDRNSLKNIIESYHKTAHFYKIDEKNLPTITIDTKDQQKLPLSTYYRLFMPNILPKNVCKVIYLDGDIVVRGNLKNLWNKDIKKVALAAVPDAQFFSSVKNSYNQLKYPPRLGYFNAGVLLINLNYWREKDVVNDFYELISSRKEGFPHHDQDILNFVFRENKFFLPLKYNLMTDFLWQPEYREISWEYDEEIDLSARNPIIIHYTGLKPWIKSCKHPYKKEFIKYKSLTEWSKTPLQINIKVDIKLWTKKVLVKLGLLNKKQIRQWEYSYADLQIRSNI